ncbi:malate synthase A [Rhodococcus jostii]|uniref:malate synthase A n=1 Tax=Rhodococcus jostii TaxID=132919 RepID=UPI0036299F14
MSITVTRIPAVDGASHILSEDALAFVERLHHRFVQTRDELMADRQSASEIASATGKLGFLESTTEIRAGHWSVAEIPDALRDRRVEITGPAGPTDMAVSALRSGARIWLADLEDAITPSWHNLIDALVNLTLAAGHNPFGYVPLGKEEIILSEEAGPTIVVRPRGWHLPENHVLIDGGPAVAALVDFGLHFFHNAAHLAEVELGPFYYLPKIESYLEARLWNDVFTFAQNDLGVAHGTVRATVLIETIPAGFQMEEILYELRDHVSALNAGRWDYLFSMIKYFRQTGKQFVIPDRTAVAMTAPFMRAYTELLVRTCHKRGAMAIGGMAALVPNREDPDVTASAVDKVRSDKTREATDGFDGSWVAHPDLVQTCREVFDSVIGQEPNQLARRREDVRVTAEQLLDVASTPGSVTEVGVRDNLYVAVAYTAEWLAGNGAVVIRNLFEDIATVEISRSQVWQQVRNEVIASDTGNVITEELVQQLLDEVTEQLRGEIADGERFDRYYRPAAELIGRITNGREEDFVEFITTPGYELLTSIGFRAGDNQFSS